MPLPVNKFSNKLALKVSNNIRANPPFCYFASFLIVSPTRFIDKPDSSRYLTIFMISFISSFEIINVVIPDSNIFLCIAASVADAIAVDSNGMKMLVANGLSTFLIKGKPVLIMVPKVFLQISVIVLFYAIKFSIISY